MLLFAGARTAGTIGWAISTAARVVALVLFAMTLTDTLTGNVADQTGAVAVGANVRAVNLGRGVERTTATNERGVFFFNDLQPGVYDVTIEAAGFRPHTTKGLAVVSNAVLRADAQLEVSALTDTVEVVATAAPLQTDQADVHVTQTAREVNALPLTGSSGQYPDQVASEVRIIGGVGGGNEYFDRSACAAVNIPAGQPQRFGSSGRNPIRGPGFWNVDLGLFRTLDFGRVKVQFRAAEALNALNHPNFSNPGGDISNAGTFGFITSTTGTGERNLRFGARVSF